MINLNGDLDADGAEDILDRVSTCLHDILEEIEYEYGVETDVSLGHARRAYEDEEEDEE